LEVGSDVKDGAQIGGGTAEILRDPQFNPCVQ